MKFLKSSTGKTFLRKTRSFLAKAAEKVETKVASKVGLHLHLSGLVTRITNVIKSRLGWKDMEKPEKKSKARRDGEGRDDS